MSAVNIIEYIGCDKCANQDECHKKCRLMPLLVMLKNDGKCEAFKNMYEAEREKQLDELGV